MTTPFHRRPRAEASDHDRARGSLANSLAGPLPDDERQWVDGHLTGCDECRAVGAAYERDRSELRVLRDRRPEPPRDLWARTSAAIERDARRSRGRRAPFVRRSRPSPIPLGAISGALVVAVVIGASLLSGNPAPTVPPSATANIMAVSLPPGSPAGSLAPTPLAVAPGQVEWMVVNASGGAEVHSARYSEVCPAGAECEVLEEPSPQEVDVQEPPRVAVLSPDDEQLVVVDAGTKGAGGDITVVAAPTDPAAQTPMPPATPTASTPPPVRTPAPVTTPGAAASPTVSVTATATAAATPSEAPASPDRTPSPDVTATATTTTTPGPTATVVEDPTPTPQTDSPTPPATDAPATDRPATDPPASDPPGSAPPEQLAIAADVVVVGETAAFSPDGSRFAFSARPADGSRGPDIYVWKVGADEATRVTYDERSVFSGWLRDLVLGSRVVAAGSSGSGASGQPDPEAADGSTSAVFVIDPETGQQQEITGAPFWRPTVDPTGTRAVYWEGTLARRENGVEWVPSRGRLAVGTWPELPALGAPSSFSPPPASGAPVEADESPRVDASSAVPPSLPAVEAPGVTRGRTLQFGAVRDWDAQWDETGTRLAVWIADPDDPTIGTLSLYLVDERTGNVDVAGAPLKDHPARPGFSIGDGRLAWATPTGQDGEGSQVQVIAWRGDDVGSIETQPGDEQVVVIR